MKTLILISFLTLAVVALPSSSNKNGRIWNGGSATPGQAPYLVGILWFEEETTVQPLNICGGGIIKPSFVVSAAHCLDNNLTGIGRFGVVAGQHFVSIANRSGREQFRNIEREIPHPLFNGGASSFDVVVIIVDVPFELNEFVQTIALPMQSSLPPQSGEVSAFGWGSIKDQQPHSLPDELQTVDLRIMPYELCREVFDVLFRGNPLSRSCMCTLMFTNSGNVCSADSGGPAVVIGEDGEPVMVGVLAWGLSKCSNPSVPTVWSAIAPVREWIDSSTE